ncbi:MAG: tyrosine--tRNA ligase [Candidatus Rokubacteria bacterium 13_1_40CM_69_27]|nr:MAG: tyrosine--tRNA ligase [Candidatus Rokubacteria bacterium 13_1_40CM_69_27]
MRTALLRDLQARGLVADMTNPDELGAHLSQGSRTVYCGFDPTAESLHAGSLLPLLALRRFQLHGHRPIVLIGGGTGLIGDPSGKAGERALNPEEQVAAWAEQLKRQVARFVDFEGPRGAKLLDNYTWLSKLNVIPFLRDVGKEFSVGAMIAKESVKSRLGRSDAGLSYTEFSYQILQAYDFLVLCRDHECTIQIGGSDQWGNITAGMDLIRRLLAAPAFGLTLPLVTKVDGTKFGKTETGTVWLDPAKTSPYEMYQFWVNTADADVVSYLKYFTFLTPDDITDLEAAVRRAPEKREAQHVLAREVTGLVHGAAGVEEAERITDALFTGDVKSLTREEAAQACSAMPRMVLTLGADPVPLAEVLIQAGLAESKKRARELIAAGAIQMNGEKVRSADAQVSRDRALHGKYLIFRKGKKTYHAVTLA